jgi:hypothetical protein
MNAMALKVVIARASARGNPLSRNLGDCFVAFTPRNDRVRGPSKKAQTKKHDGAQQNDPKCISSFHVPLQEEFS